MNSFERRGERANSVATSDELVINVMRRTVSLGGVSVSLTKGEMRVLCAIAEKGGEGISRDEIFDTVYSDSSNPPFHESIIWVRIHSIRKKLGKALGAGSWIVTENRRYSLKPPELPQERTEQLTPNFKKPTFLK